MITPKIRIRLRSYDYKLLDKSVLEILETARSTGARVAGPIPLPTEINKYTVLRSPHITLPGDNRCASPGLPPPPPF